LRHAFQTSDKLYMVTDYCPGGELFFHLKRLRRFTEGESQSMHGYMMMVIIMNVVRNDEILLSADLSGSGSSTLS
jgi:hypothetical protein